MFTQEEGRTSSTTTTAGGEEEERVRSFWGWGYETEHAAVRNEGLWALLRNLLQITDEEQDIVPPSLEQIAATLRRPRISIQDIPQHLRGICSSSPFDRYLFFSLRFLCK